ncbi:MAG: BamA/TamA family outer membrane protein [Candidatus Krumholzibacteriota bacterium]|nr:BamA/TamA family outer membrane protein [Candidatus Krumholzibacteriota bacterium]
MDLEPELLTLKIFLIIFILLSIFIPYSGITAHGDPGEPANRAAGDPEEELAAKSPGMFDNLARKLGFDGSGDHGMEPAFNRERFDSKISPCLGSVIDTIIVTGNRYTRASTITRVMASRTGSRLDNDVIFRDDSYLRGLGFFSMVNISVEQTGAERCRLIVHVEERPKLFMKYPMPVANYDFDKGLSYGIRWRIKNFRGLGEDILMQYEERSGKERGGGISWFAPWLGDQRIRLSTSLYNFTRLEAPENNDYIRERNGGRIMIGFPLTDDRMRQLWLSPSFGIEGRLSKLTIDKEVEVPAGEWIDQLFLSYGVHLSYDSRDNIIAPLDGYFTAIGVNRFVTIDGYIQQFAFYRYISNLYLPVRSFGTLIIAADLENRDGDLPSFYSMRLGGRTELRGYMGKEGGRSRIIGSLQWRKPIFGPVVFSVPLIGRFDLQLNGVAFVDNGTLMSSFTELSGSRFMTSGGFGFEILSPVQDMIRIECAFCEDERPAFYLTTNTQF